MRPYIFKMATNQFQMAIIHFFFTSPLPFFAGFHIIKCFLVLFPLVTEVPVIATVQMLSFGKIYITITYISLCIND